MATLKGDSEKNICTGRFRCSWRDPAVALPADISASSVSPTTLIPLPTAKFTTTAVELEYSTLKTEAKLFAIKNGLEFPSTQISVMCGPCIYGSGLPYESKAWDFRRMSSTACMVVLVVLTITIYSMFLVSLIRFSEQ
ncbi:hypothetical protein DFH07DRAFT_1062667 [Mycena maculata]|uniref:Uncharacterized protein n=1 Tax=Mycena maculata TaxID=230809 RepID=A0AAD7N5Y0_9AGAR|nr:hypothetical protein DFH07DRAFT_1062667 [Mycena maculata]